MRKTAAVVGAVVLSFAFVLGGCGEGEPGDVSQSGLTVEKVGTILGLDLPECFVIDRAGGMVYISNVVTEDKAFWVDDANGFISQMSPDGKIEKLRWLESSAAMAINDPKGMCILGGRLYFNDNDTLKHCSLGTPGEVQAIALEGAKKLNDLATDGESIWVADTEAGNAYCISPDGTSRLVKGPAGINGITCFGGKVFAVSWDLHEVYELDPAGEKEPVSFGLASHFTALDGIEVLDDGTFIVSDYQGNKLCSISADRKTVTTLIELESPADFLLDRENDLLYVPEMLVSRAVILKLKR